MVPNQGASDKEMLKVITDKKLLSEIGNAERNGSTPGSLESYIILSQILILTLFTRIRSEVMPFVCQEINIH
jgi:hypothetical protein